jgi:hypothetical protein
MEVRGSIKAFLGFGAFNENRGKRGGGLGLG